MSAYTPGSWRFEPHVGGQWFGNIVSYGYGKNEVGIQTIRTIDCLRRGASQTELEATAHLIAAAPDLLEALKAVVAIADRATVEFDRARAAIAKATNAGTR